MADKVTTRLPPWFKVSLGGSKPRAEVRAVLDDLGLHSVCEEARCPNLCECWRGGTATFMILGSTCTRNCAFCAVHSGPAEVVDQDEPERVAEAAARLKLKHVVVTSVTRDDLPDGGAGQFADTVNAVKKRLPAATVEVLTPDFGGDAGLIRQVLAACPNVFNHNIETCRRLTAAVRDRADYDRSLDVLRCASESTHCPPVVKSGFMLGLGETETDINEMFADLKGAGVTSITIGQYLPPSDNHWPVDRYVPPAEFDAWAAVARERYGFRSVASGPKVRSSYHAADGLACG